MRIVDEPRAGQTGYDKALHNTVTVMRMDNVWSSQRGLVKKVQRVAQTPHPRPEPLEQAGLRRGATGLYERSRRSEDRRGIFLPACSPAGGDLRDYHTPNLVALHPLTRRKSLAMEANHNDGVPSISQCGRCAVDASVSGHVVPDEHADSQTGSAVDPRH